MTSRRLAVVVCSLVAAGIVLRLWILGSDLGALDGDEAVWGVMARHVLDGEFSAFFWGQAYGGTQEALLTAAVFSVAGPSVGTLRVVPLALFAAAALLTWRIGVRTIGEPYARIGAAIVWAWPAYLVWKSTRAHGFYGAGIVLGLLVVLLALRLAERSSRSDVVLLGLAFGLGWWATPQVLLLDLPAVAWLIWCRPAVLREGWLAVPAAALGALPWLVANATHDWYSLGLGPSGSSGAGRMHNLVVATGPSALGARLPFTLEWVGGAFAGAAIYLVLLALLAWTLFRRWSSIGPLLPVLALFPIFYAASPYASLNTEPRYLVLFGPILALLLTAAASSARSAVAIACAMVVLTTTGLILLQRSEYAFAYPEGVPVPADIDPLLRTLEAEHIRHAYADYWIAWRVVFESKERIIAVPPGSDSYAIRRGRVVPVAPELGRYPPFYRRVAASRRAAYVVLEGGNRERQVRRPLEAAGYIRRLAADFVVYLPPSR